MNMLKSIVFFSVSVVYATCSHDVLFHRHRGKYLLNSVIRTVHAETESECGIYCSRDDACVSVNYKTTGKDRGLCELNHKTFTDASSNSAERKEFNYLEILRKVWERVQNDMLRTDSTTAKSFARNCVGEANFDSVDGRTPPRWSDTSEMVGHLIIRFHSYSTPQQRITLTQTLFLTLTLNIDMDK